MASRRRCPRRFLQRRRRHLAFYGMRGQRATNAVLESFVETRNATTETTLAIVAFRIVAPNSHVRRTWMAVEWMTPRPRPRPFVGERCCNRCSAWPAVPLWQCRRPPSLTTTMARRRRPSSEEKSSKFEIPMAIPPWPTFHRPPIDGRIHPPSKLCPSCWYSTERVEIAIRPFTNSLKGPPPPTPLLSPPPTTTTRPEITSTSRPTSSPPTRPPPPSPTISSSWPPTSGKTNEVSTTIPAQTFSRSSRGFATVGSNITRLSILSI
mmetsp:Transcript_8691/g.18256  ORF Transcript_8691/g.18256 Transcript_8691/m.18256 type:complete len:265 (+) Transcript_8691:146-940(+)